VLPELEYIYEHLIAKYYGWTIKEIRSLDLYDFQVHLRLCLVSEGIERDFRVMLAGGGSAPSDNIDEPVYKGGGSVTKNIRQKFDAKKGDFKSGTSSAPDKIYQAYNPKTGMLINRSNK